MGERRSRCDPVYREPAAGRVPGGHGRVARRPAAERPVVLADQFLKVFDGMSIGSNDLAQLTLGIDRDGNEKIRSISNENDQAVKSLISEVIKKCKASGKYVGICGQAPSDYPEFTEFLVKEGIESISLNPDTVIKTTFLIYKTEHNL